MDVIKEEESKDKVIDSLQQSGSYNKIIKLQNGLDTPLTTKFKENGTGW